MPQTRHLLGISNLKPFYKDVKKIICQGKRNIKDVQIFAIFGDTHLRTYNLHTQKMDVLYYIKKDLVKDDDLMVLIQA